MKKSNKRLDFLPNRQNKYSIRKFTVGTASILVGAILLFGAQNDAQAEEAPADSASSTTETKALDVSPVEASTAEVAPTAPTETTEATSTEATTEPTTTEPTTTETSTTETTTEEATAEKATSETKPADSTETPSSTEEATTEPASAEPTTTESSTTEPATVEPATTEQPSKEATTSNEVTSEAPSTESAPVDSTQEATSAPSTPATETPAVDAPAITSEATAVDYVANTTSLSSTEAETLVSDLNLDYNNLTPEELQAALIDGLVAQQNATATEATPLDRRQTSALSDIDSVTYGTTAFRAAVTPETALADNATYQPYAKQDPTNYRYGTLGDATEAIANTAELPADTQYTFKDNNVFQRVGNQLATVVATYADGTTDEVLAPIYVSYAYEKDGVSYSGVPYSAENNFTRTEEDVHIVPNLEDLSSTESRADNTIDFDLSAVFNLVRVNSGMETYIELDERIAQYVTSIDGNIASTAAGASPDRPFVWERVVNAKGELTNTWKMRSFNALAYSDGETSVFLGDQPSVSQVSSSTINLSDTVENIFANDPLLQNGDLAFRTYTLTEEGQIVNTTDRTNYFQVAQDEKDTLTEATALTERNWFTGSGAITRYEAQAGNNGGIVFDQYFTKSSNGTLNGYGAQPNRDWTYNFEIDPRLLPYIDDVEIHYLDENGVDWTASTELSDRFANESSLTKNQGWNNFEYRYNNGTSIESAYTTGTTWNDTRDGAPDKDAYTVPDVELQPGQGYMSLDAVMINVDSRQLNFRPGLIQPAKVRVVATLKDGVSINDVLGQNRDENFGFTGYLVNGKNEIIPNTAGTGYYQAMDVDGDGIVDEIDPSIETPDAPPQTADNFTPVGQPIETPVGVTPDPRDGITNLGELPPDATYNWEVVPNVDTPTTPGNPIQAAVIVTYVDGSQDRVEVPITVTDTPVATPPEAPVVTNPQPNDGTVTGTSNEPGGTVTVTFPNGEVVTGTVDEDGTWTVNVPPTETLEQGEVITATITDDNGNTSTPGSGTVTDTIAPDAPVVTNPQPNDGTVTGTSNEPGGTVTVTFPNGDVVTGTVGEDGTWTVDVPPTTTLTEGDIITATVEDDNGNVSTPGNGTVTDTIAPDAPVVNNPQPNDGTVTGSGEPGGTVVVTFPNGDVVTGTVGEDGTWTVNVPPTETLEEGEVVTAVITDDNGNTSTPGNGTVTDTIAPDAPVVNDPQPNDGIVTGSGEPGETVVVTFPNGDVVTGTVGEDGTWTVNVPPTETLEEGEVVTAVITDDNGNTSTPGNGTVTDTIAPDAPVVNNPQPNDGTVTGSGEPGGTVVVTFPNGDVVTGTVGEDGTWTVDVPPTETLEEGEIVTAVVTDDNGNTSTPGNGTVTDTIAPDAPVVNNPQPNDGTVTGTGEPGGTVTVTFPNGEVVTGTVDEDGTWTVDVPPTVTLTEGDIITATVEDDNGNVSTPGNGTVTDTIAPEAPVVNDPQPNDGTVTGTGEPGGTVTVTFPNGEVVTGTVEEDGTWTVDVPPTVTLTEGDVITATVEDDNGNVSTPGNGTVTDTIAPDAPVVNNPQPNDGTVTGTGEPGGTVTVTFPNGEVVTGTVEEDGTWTVDVPPTVTLTEGDVITATVEDDNGNVSTPGNGTVTDTIAPDAPVVNNPQPNDGTVTGTGEPGGTVTVTFPNGEVVTGTVDEDGTWTVDVPPTVTLTEGDVITATVEDDNGNVSTPGNGTVTDTIAPDAPVVNNPQPNDGTVTGTGEPGGTVTVTFPNGEVVTGTVEEDGTWTVDVPPTVTLTEGDVITATVEDDNGNVSTPGNGTVTDTIAPDAPVVNNPQPNDGTVTGTGEPGGTVTVTFPNGEVVTGTVDEDGTWTVDVPPTVTLTEGDVITATVEDDNGNVSTPGNGTVTDTIAPDAPVVNNPQPNDGTVTGTGEPGGTVTVTFPNGEVVTGTVEEDGTWTVDVPPTVTLTEGDVITATVEDDNGNVSTPGNGTVTDTIAPEPPVVDPIKPGDTVVTGEGEPGGTVTVTFPNGDVVTGTVGEDGTWAVDVPPTVTIKDGDTIVVTQTDKGGNESDSTTVVVTGDKDDSTTPPVDNSGNNDGNNDCPVVKPIQNNDTSVTGQTEPGAPVKVEFPGDTTVTTEADDEGQFTVSVPQHVALNDGDTVKVTGSEDKPATAKVGELPETGSTTNPTLFGGLIAALGSLFLFGRRRKEKEEQ
ncbi:YSIRK-type signal peptide-containing protein [Staphylococcus chromogenes]|uniref:Ig-like domain-containing protein n=4 Tax=Staphylococcus chromogenes TaxID=46126 RepID=UPI000E692E81|nr:Ig-like domain-containing protein [Staphylococcus chromogenes]RIL91965.1 YSIRK-type signal peptide-containing protein [Staphylococcus chromogenes]